MGSRKLRRLLRRKPPVALPEPELKSESRVEPEPDPELQRNLKPELQRESKLELEREPKPKPDPDPEPEPETEPEPDGSVQKTMRTAVPGGSHDSLRSRMLGPFLLRQFIATLGPRAEVSLSRSLSGGGGGALRQAAAWHYVFRQGRDEHDLAAIRAQLSGRVARSGARMHGGGWTRLMLGDEFSSGGAKKQTHALTFVVPYCVCVNCRVEGARADRGLEDMDAMLEEAERGEGFGEGRGGAVELGEGVLDEKEEPGAEEQGRAQGNLARRVGELGGIYRDLPRCEELELIGDMLGRHEFELGTVSKISSRGARVQFSGLARRFLESGRCSGPLSMQEVAEAVSRRAREHYRKHKGKTGRRFYVHGTLNKFALEETGIALGGRDGSVGVLFRRQVMSVFTGRLALEDSFGAFLGMEEEFYVGFGQDAEGAQTVAADGRLGEARHIGINELRTHVDFNHGGEVRVEVR